MPKDKNGLRIYRVLQFHWVSYLPFMNRPWGSLQLVSALSLEVKFPTLKDDLSTLSSAQVELLKPSGNCM
jgi:hypothetical protein